MDGHVRGSVLVVDDESEVPIEAQRALLDASSSALCATRAQMGLVSWRPLGMQAGPATKGIGLWS